MLRIIGSLNVSELELANGNNKDVRYGIGSNGQDFAKKLGKLKGQNLSKFQILAKAKKSC